MTTNEIAEMAKEFEEKPELLKQKLLDLIESGAVEDEIEIDEAIGYGSDAYPSGFPGLYDSCPTWWAIYQTEQERKNGNDKAFCC